MSSNNFQHIKLLQSNLSQFQKQQNGANQYIDTCIELLNDLTKSLNKHTEITDDTPRLIDLFDAEDTSSETVTQSIDDNTLEPTESKSNHKTTEQKETDTTETTEDESETNVTQKDVIPFKPPIDVTEISDDEHDSDVGSFVPVKKVTLKHITNTATTEPQQRKRGRKSIVEHDYNKQNLTDEKYVVQLGPTQWQCDLCTRECSTKNELLTHIRSAHTKNKPYQCQYCSHRFADSSGRSKHEKTHKKVMKHICMLCDTEFKFDVQLKKHIKDKHPTSTQDDEIDDTQ